jgi:hypothetical protein
MDRKELERLNRLARSLVRGFPIVASVRYETPATRLAIACRSMRGPTKKPSELKREWSPTVGDYVDLDRYVRDHVGAFLRLWIKDDQAHSDAGDHQGDAPERRPFVSDLSPVACQKPNDDATSA